MATPKEYRANLVENRALFQAALHGATAAWDRKPPSGEGEDSWAPRQVAEHVIGSEWYFTNLISIACGAPESARPSIDASSPAAAAADVTRVGAICDNILRHVSDADLAKTHEHERFGTLTVARMLEIMDSHGKDHLNQLKTASAS
jgi:hypothetical protein